MYQILKQTIKYLKEHEVDGIRQRSKMEKSRNRHRFAEKIRDTMAFSVHEIVTPVSPFERKKSDPYLTSCIKITSHGIRKLDTYIPTNLEKKRPATCCI